MFLRNITFLSFPVKCVALLKFCQHHMPYRGYDDLLQFSSVTILRWIRKGREEVSRMSFETFLHMCCVNNVNFMELLTPVSHSPASVFSHMNQIQKVSDQLWLWLLRGFSWIFSDTKIVFNARNRIAFSWAFITLSESPVYCKSHAAFGATGTELIGLKHSYVLWN
jgi:hypothetical protein